MSQLSSRLARALAASVVVIAVVAACGSEGGSSFDNGDQSGDAGNDGPSSVNNGSSGTLASSSSGGPGKDGGDGTSSGDDNPNCKKLTCADQALECGAGGDGCGGQIDCGTCGDGKRCGGPNALSKCVDITTATSCVPKKCDEQNIGCGAAGDGCGGVLDCGTCPSGQQCGIDGNPSHCVNPFDPDAGGHTCVPKTKTEYNAEDKNCGDQSDGCGGIIHLGDCVSPEFCGGGGPSKCAVAGGGTCTKKTCADYTTAGTCGPQPDGCGGVTANCGSCTLPAVCGGGGEAGKCGGGVLGGGVDGGACTPKTVAQCTATQCGFIPDGCGGVVDCGTTKCTGGQICGGGGTANVCGAPTCVKKTACPANMNCGTIADGCGGTINCGTTACTAPAICGGGGQANVCGGGVVTADGGAGGGTCTKKTVANCGTFCGKIADGCGGIVDCGTAKCTGGNTCGGGNTDNVCGGACVPKANACAGLNCGVVADGCGGSVGCWAGGATTGTCPVGANIGDSCGGGGNANICGGGVLCTGFCQSVDRTCAAGDETSITGTVTAPGLTGFAANALPLPGALVYIPNGATTEPYGVSAISTGVTGTCETCNSQTSGSPLIQTTSGTNGKFTLTNVPAGIVFPLVVQLGKWRKLIKVGPLTKCTQPTLDGGTGRPLARMPHSQHEQSVIDNIPYTAISTGQVDGLECVFRKLGIDDSEFGNPDGSGGNKVGGRIRIYKDQQSGSAKPGATIDSHTPVTDDALTNDVANLNKYDAVVFSCAGAANTRDATHLNRVKDYADHGGRVFATHYEYVYLYNTTDYKATADWTHTDDDNPGDGSWNGTVDTTAGKRATFASWLELPGVSAATGTPPVVSITEARNDVRPPVAHGAESWITHAAGQNGNNSMLHYTFNTPIDSGANSCGRVLFSDFHVSLGNTNGDTYPAECPTSNGRGALTAQEKILAFFLFDLTSCIDNGPPPNTCTPRTCASPENAGKCGPQSDGCGGLTPSCGTCSGTQACGAGGTPGQCGTAQCSPNVCTTGCGTISDGCGGTVNCPACAAGTTCGGGGQAGVCGTPSCKALSCTDQGIECGEAGDGCGNVQTCPACPAGTTCGGGGVANKCGKPACTKITTCPAGKTCGDVPDGCGGKVHCGDCGAGQTCGGGGTANVCGAGSCTAQSCSQLGADCGTISDGCGGVTTCPDCTGGAFCNAQNLCVAPTCTAKSCTQLGVECGQAANGCGGLTADCGTCGPGTACGATSPNKCGTVSCTPLSCSQVSAVCGQVADGCGGLTQSCGDCVGTTACKNGACVNACTPRSCADAGAQCGFISDGCGGALDCGTCAAGSTCGLNGQANKCGSDGPK